MFQAFVITLREGFEAFLIIAVMASYLSKTNRSALLSAVVYGVACSVAASIAMGFMLAQGVNEPLWEGVLGLVAAVLVVTLVVHMWKHAKFLKSHLEARLETAAVKTTASAWWGVFLLTLFMISREGMETVLLLIQVPEGHVVQGVVAGLAATAIYSLAWLKLSQHLNIRLFFQVTGIFLILFAVQVLIYSLHEFSEAGVVPGLEAFHEATEPFSPSGFYGRWFSLFTVGVAMFWLCLGWLRTSVSYRKRSA